MQFCKLYKISINRPPVFDRLQGHHCLTPLEFDASHENYDTILMCHIIEHFQPKDLLAFMEKYLDRLKPGGHLILSTPLLSKYFYYDFDHIKPYSPVGINMVFQPSSVEQVQYYSRNKLELKDIWFRKGFFRFSYLRSKYVRTWFTPLLKIMELLSSYVTFLSCGLIGKTDGWVGIYKKNNNTV